MNANQQTDTCAHAPCNCAAPEPGGYCSEHCRNAGTGMETLRVRTSDLHRWAMQTPVTRTSAGREPRLRSRTIEFRGVSFSTMNAPARRPDSPSSAARSWSSQWFRRAQPTILRLILGLEKADQGGS
jgi:hypothetical protein